MCGYTLSEAPSSSSIFIIHQIVVKVDGFNTHTQKSGCTFGKNEEALFPQQRFYCSPKKLRVSSPA